MTIAIFIIAFIILWLSQISVFFSCVGTVPVYLGDAAHLKALLPHPKAAIFIADYNGNYTQLAKYLTYLSNNETAYESHREWRRNFTYESNIKDKPLLQTSWYCNVCRWAADNVSKISPNKTSEICLTEDRIKHFSTTIASFEGQAVRTNSNHEIFFVANGTLRLIPDSDTLESLHFHHDDVLYIADVELKLCLKGLPLPPIGNIRQKRIKTRRRMT